MGVGGEIGTEFLGSLLAPHFRCGFSLEVMQPSDSELIWNWFGIRVLLDCSAAALPLLFIDLACRVLVGFVLPSFPRDSDTQEPCRVPAKARGHQQDSHMHVPGGSCLSHRLLPSQCMLLLLRWFCSPLVVVLVQSLNCV